MEKARTESFGELELVSAVSRAIQEMGFEEPTPIQKMAIPPAMEGRDLIGQAQTGTGKTASFGIPIIQKDFSGKKPFALILEPTRELAQQVSAELTCLAKYRKCSIVTIYGGASIVEQMKALRQGANIVVGTPGRMIDHLTRGTLSLAAISTVVLDEADEMLDMGFIDDIETILGMTPETRQTLLYSATMPPEILKISKKYMRDPVKIAINVKDIIAPNINQVFYEVPERAKSEVLRRLLDVESPERTLIFCHTKREVDEIASALQKLGYNAGALHGDYTQVHREDVLGRFRGGRIDILVATDVAGRGIDIENISHVINYSIPQNPEGYIHRIGRTGRAGRSGIAVTFVTPREYRQLQHIERVAKTKLKRREIPSASEVKKARRKVIRDNIAEIIQKGLHLPYLTFVKELSESEGGEEIAAAALSLAYGNMEVPELAAPRRERDTRERDRTSRGTGEKGMTRLFMTVGRKDRVQTAEILKAIASEAGIPGKTVGKIDIMESFTFFEVPSDIVERVLTAMNRVVIRGRKIAVTRAKAPSKTEARPGRGR